MISDSVMSNEQYEENLKELRAQLLYSVHIDGYINLFQNIQNEQKMLCLFITPENNIENYYKYIDQIPDQIFVTFHWNISPDKKEEHQNNLRKKYPDKCMFVAHDTHSPIIEFFCLHYCSAIIILDSVDDYLLNAIHENTIVYSLSKNAMYNTTLKHLQMLM